MGDVFTEINDYYSAGWLRGLLLRAWGSGVGDRVRGKGAGCGTLRSLAAPHYQSTLKPSWIWRGWPTCWVFMVLGISEPKLTLVALVLMLPSM